MIPLTIVPMARHPDDWKSMSRDDLLFMLLSAEAGSEAFEHARADKCANRELSRRRRSPTMPVCRKCAVRFEPLRANSRFFNTSVKCFRAGLVEGKSLKRVVSAEGIEPSTY